MDSANRGGAGVIGGMPSSFHSSYHPSMGATMLPVVTNMKLFANWEVDRASSRAVRRVLSVDINKLIISRPVKSDNVFCLSFRLQGYKRTLRSNDITIASSSATCSMFEIPLNISLSIHYSHFLKRKANVLQILIQRRKRYKNRPIPGYKTLAIGYLNLDDVLQHFGLREVRIWDTIPLNKNDAELTEFGTIYISNCQTHAQDADGTQKGGGKEGLPLSEEDEDVSTDESDFDVNDGEFGEGTPREMKALRSSRKKKLNQKNIKSKLTALLKRFKVPEGGAGSTTGTLPPTAEELEEIFEELENISDSGPELEPDKMSIMSNPKPGLRPFFGSKTDILPSIEDRVPSEESAADSDEPDFSSDNENQPIFISSLDYPDTPGDPKTPKSSSGKPSGTPLHWKEKITHSSTINSMGEKGDASLSLAKRPSEAVTIAEVMSQLDDPAGFIASNIWLASSNDVSWLSRVDPSLFKTVKLIDCPFMSDVRAALQAIVGRIQKFCNSNAESPPTTVIGILGGDRLVANVLRAYVDLLQNKTAQDWLNYLRFTLLSSPNSVIGRMLATVANGGLLDNQWKTFNKISPSDTGALEECLCAAAHRDSTRSLNVPIGEVMLQMNQHEPNGGHGVLPGTSGDTPGGDLNGNGDSQVFIPFIAEIHLGNLDELNSLHYMKPEDEKAVVNACGSSSSPPSSPHLAKTQEWQELQVEYWTVCTQMNSDVLPNAVERSQFSAGHSSSLMSTPPGPKSSNGGKFSMKASVRTLSIAREPMSTLLSMLFVKERKKDKVLHKLGRKTKPRSADSFNSQSRVVSSVNRMICSGKNTPLEVSIDGVTWNRIRFFQITSQWQTHVKYFPLSVPSIATTARSKN